MEEGPFCVPAVTTYLYDGLMVELTILVRDDVETDIDDERFLRPARTCGTVAPLIGDRTACCSFRSHVPYTSFLTSLDESS